MTKKAKTVKQFYGGYMPKTFSEYERNKINLKLLAEAEACLIEYGVRRTTVDEIVKRVNIPKGTFYLFYESKELLFFEVFMQYHDRVQAELLAKIQALKDDASAYEVADVIFDLYKDIENSFIYKIVVNDEFDLLMRKLPPEIAQKHSEKDDLSLVRFISMLPNIKAENIDEYSAAFRAVFLTMLHKREIGDAVFDKSMRLLINGIMLQVYGGKL